MKIKKSNLKEIIKESFLEEFFGRAPKIKSTSEDEAIIDIWANLLDLASRDVNWTKEIFEEVPERTLNVLGFNKEDRERVLAESADQFKKTILRNVGRNSAAMQTLRDDLIKLARNGKISRDWMTSSSGHADLVQKLAPSTGAGAPAPEPEATETGTSPRLTPAAPGSPAAPMERSTTPYLRFAKDETKKELQKDLDPKLKPYITQMAYRRREAEGNKVLNAFIDDIVNLIHEPSLSKVSESRLRHMIIQETIKLLKEQKKIQLSDTAFNI